MWLRGVVQQRPHGLDLTYRIITLLLTWSGRSADIYQVVYAVSHCPEIITFVSVISPSLTRLYTPGTEFLFNNCLLTLAFIYYIIFVTSDCIILLPSAWVLQIKGAKMMSLVSLLCVMRGVGPIQRVTPSRKGKQ